ncbi:Katanin p80 WD40 repeat-containing subunit B1-1-like protein [Morus notabilis]|uniref:Katanin p80 WD40 repeat-containing subunit B1 homolog n=1 Tax=Morus notabilis TaxID=981085 RepID=W9S1G8_9ROSA|nr:Katanin p80 WD40 repeat-containing subunit B1-1-like protein [Morus notabilis]
MSEALVTAALSFACYLGDECLTSEEFVAHSAAVNCLKIGRKSSRLLVTGGEDHKVNLWAIGKPNAILSLSGHTSGIDSVSFDSSEVLVAAGAASGTIKLWDLEEAKIVRTLTGHRSNCISVDFHPFGEFFASGSLDTNLKIWDIRKKGCIHTYKGHTRGVNAIRFTPDGRWVVSGGEDNTVKVQCIDFHPHEFLLATGSADRTVKFWDLETFELIGSAGPETTGVRCLTFNPDGRTLLCGLHESLKVFSWEPIRCHDGVDVGWSKLSDLNVHEGKLLGCSYNQSCVGVWVVDITRIEPYAVGNARRLNGHSESKTTAGGNICVLNENSSKASLGRLPVSQSSDPLVKETKSLGRLSVSQNSDVVREPKVLAYETRGHKMNRDACTIGGLRAGRARSIAVNWERRERYSNFEGPTSSVYSGAVSAANMLPLNMSKQRGYPPPVEKESVSASDEDAIADVMEQHNQFLSSMQSRSAKLQGVYRYWERNDVKGVISAMEKMADHAVAADVVSIMTEKIDIVTLDICTCLLPLLSGLLESDMDRLERCNICFVELEKVKRCFPVLTRCRLALS